MACGTNDFFLREKTNCITYLGISNLKTHAPLLTLLCRGPGRGSFILLLPIVIALLQLTAIATHDDDLMYLHLLNNTNISGAVCLDGTPGK